MAESAIVELKGDMTHAGIASGKKQVLKALESSSEVAIDLSGVSSFDLALPQLIISTQMSAAAKSKRLTFPGLINTELVRMAFDLGLARPEGVGEEWPW